MRWKELEVPGLSIIAGLIGAGASSFNKHVNEATDSWLDLKVLLPLGLLGAGVYKALRTANWLGQVPAFVLFYYAFDSYMKFHPVQVSVVASVDETNGDLPDKDNTQSGKGGFSRGSGSGP